MKLKKLLKEGKSGADIRMDEEDNFVAKSTLSMSMKKSPVHDRNDSQQDVLKKLNTSGKTFRNYNNNHVKSLGDTTVRELDLSDDKDKEVSTNFLFYYNDRF